MLDEKNLQYEDLDSKANALAFNLATLATFFWLMCVLFWILMARTLRGRKLLEVDGGKTLG
eukprot:CAMPEP_0118716078 /NCGR_PEP_ID=MMETSP0800-20121206/27288_1 /TAXON_ID=210618 ORGANISM="Striatella unipunctata, Strain CCMP2910" /NCGR_SAMPLE_ID=MMETSP0800 /ASSEMBLY_ACC=CAM_ASM_000638 /LENGTH=60 /DNA_ID=CAMNT_0006622433 /DNA_START=206 /DNA_END=388 /DNA_ORIENTATION=-